MSIDNAAILCCSFLDKNRMAVFLHFNALIMDLFILTLSAEAPTGNI